MNVSLGQRVRADKVYEFPSKEMWNEDDEVVGGFIDNPLLDKVAFVVGESRRRYRGKVNYYIEGDGGATCGSEGYYVDMLPSKRIFIVIRYTLRGRRYFTTPEYLKEA